MIEATLQDYFFLASTSILLAALISLKLYHRSKKSIGAKELVGGGAGFLAFSCPICNVLLVSALGAGTVLTFIEPLRPIAGIASIAILGFLLYKELTCEDCKDIKQQQKQGEN